jgi:hypothetical protein
LSDLQPTSGWLLSHRPCGYFVFKEHGGTSAPLFFKKMPEGVTASQAVAEFCGDKMTLANQHGSTGQGNV